MEGFLDHAIMNSGVVSLALSGLWLGKVSIIKDKRYKSGERKVNVGTFKFLKILFYSGLVGIPIGIVLTLFGVKL